MTAAVCARTGVRERVVPTGDNSDESLPALPGDASVDCGYCTVLDGVTLTGPNTESVLGGVVGHSISDSA